MYFKQITVEGMGCLSYLIGCPQAKVACVVDPKRGLDHRGGWRRLLPELLPDQAYG